ncbi:hypothetical protein [Thiomicrorhabdus sp.]|uniref:hypothetical protein n=1 Tax=Thiomicrorhabdus sp. TaxID=2039724 RepID=UPI002AA6D430|nr:hypothetical protein [Thiomicrorhabdus sp.]
MSVPLGFKRVLHLDNQYWLLEGKKATLVDSLEEISGPKIVLSDFNHALTGIETVHQGSSYAAAVIEKQLRSRGDMEGASEVLVLKSQKAAKAQNVFYAALPINEYAAYLEVIKKHSDHCLYIPLWSVMLKVAEKGISAVVVQHGDVLDVVVADTGFPIHSIRVSSASYDGQDWDSALGYLTTEFNHLESEQSVRIENVQWFLWCADDSPAELAERFESLSGRTVSLAKKQSISVNNTKFESNLDGLFQSASSCDAIKGETSKVLFNFERILPWVASVVLAISVGAFIAGFNWQKSAEDYADSTKNLLVSSEFESKLMNVKQLVAKNNQTAGILEKDKIDFIEELYVIAQSNSIPQMIADLQTSVNKFIHINDIRLYNQDEDEPHGMVVDGFVDQDLDFASKQVRMFIERLGEKGYQIEDKGFVAKNGNNGFQLIMIPGNKE